MTKIPTIDQLTEIVPSKYALVIISAKRARQLKNMPDLDFEHGEKAIIRALEEIAAGEVEYHMEQVEAIDS